MKESGIWTARTEEHKHTNRNMQRYSETNRRIQSLRQGRGNLKMLPRRKHPDDPEPQPTSQLSSELRGIETDRDRQPDRRTGKYPDRALVIGRHIHTYKQTNKRTHTHRDIPTGRRKDRETCRPTYGEDTDGREEAESEGGVGGTERGRGGRPTVPKTTHGRPRIHTWDLITQKKLSYLATTPKAVL